MARGVSSRKKNTIKKSAKGAAQKTQSKKTEKKTTKKSNTKKSLKEELIQEIIIPVIDIVEEPIEIFSEDSFKDEETVVFRKTGIDDILFKVPHIIDPLVGTPKDVQTELDKLAISIQHKPESKKSEHSFNRIHLFMQGYLINVALKQFPYIKGYQTSDVYQEALIALRFKAIPNFKEGKGMSFLNFAKMCIRRHLITLLNASHMRQKDQSINRAISLDSASSNGDGEESRNTLANIIPDGKDSVSEQTEQSESYEVTKNTLLSGLSEFEQVVLYEYLTGSSYREIAKSIAVATGKKRITTKSVDNALLRIRKKAAQLIEGGKLEEMPMFLV